MWPIKWEKLNNDTREWTGVENQSGGGSKLIIESLSESDLGEYRCTSKNSIGEAEISLNLNEEGGAISIDDESEFKSFPRFHPSYVSEVRKLHQRRKSGLELRKSRFRTRMRKMRRFKQKKSLPKMITKSVTSTVLFSSSSSSENPISFY